MSILYFNAECNEGLTLEEVQAIRDASLRLVDNQMHPRYQMAVNDLFKASNALMNEMKLDEMKSFSGSI